MSGVLGRTAAVGSCLGLLAAVVSSGSLRASDEPARKGSIPGDVDIDGDGRADLLIGNGNGFVDGAIHVLYGDGGRQRITVESLRPRRSYRGFGGRIVACDVNGDGFSDVVAGAEFAIVGGVEAGKVVVLYGASSGLSPRRLSVLSQSTPGVPGVSESLDSFGASIACGRLNGDRFDDVAVGVPGESWRARPGHRRWLGRLVVVPGGVNGVVPTRSWAFNQDSQGIPDRTEQFDQFGLALSTADVTGDGRDELIVWGNEGDQLDGALFVVPGTPARVRAEDATAFYGRTEGLPKLGLALVAGNFDRRGPNDVIVSSGPFEGMGAVTMLRGTPSGLTTSRSRTIRRHSAGMPRLFEGWEAFGESLAAGDVDGDGDDDILVSSPAERVSGVGTAGRVFLIRGRLGGITTEGVQRFSADSPGVPGRAHGGGGFGLCIDLMDLDGDQRTEAVIRHERIDETFAAIGLVTILQATRSGLTARGARNVDPSEFGLDPRTEGHSFGCDLAG